MFSPLTKSNVKDIVRIQLNQLTSKLKKQDIRLFIKEEAIDWISEAGYDPFFGARPVKRVIQKNVMNELSKAILSDRIDTSKNVVLDVIDGNIIFRKPIIEAEEV